jgi:lipopolysaccharide/colanic/teichoic acid biosynthesis glycosyltransferase
LTGLWQVNGRSDASYRARVAMDVVYARKRGPLLDLKILIATIPAVLLSRGSY